MYDKEENKVTDGKKAGYKDLFWVFMVGSVLGFFLEGIWSILTKGAWADHSATVWGPFCIVYGIGAMVLYYFSFVLQQKRMRVQFVVCGAVGAGVEYASSLFQEILFGSTSWDYSEQFLNLGGRISLRMTLLWGMLGILFVRFVFPVLYRMLARINGREWNILCILLSAFMGVNLAVTSITVLRWRERITGIPASNGFEEFIDENYSNEVMADIFSNMVFEDEK